MGKRALDAASAYLRRAGYRAREAGATCGSGHAHAERWIDRLDDN